MERQMKHSKAFIFGIFILGILGASCRQEPIFYIISEENLQKEAYIPGTPTKMVVFEREFLNLDFDPDNPAGPDNLPTISVPILYVASGTKLHWYAKPGKTSTEASTGNWWDSSEYYILPPLGGGRIIDITASSDYLYALCMDEKLNTTLYRIGAEITDTEWQKVDNNSEYLTQTVYADSYTETVFAGAKSGDTYAILYLKDTGTELKVLLGNTAMLQGTVFNESDSSFLLATRGRGIYMISKTDIDNDNVAGVTQSDIKKANKDGDFDDIAKDRIFLGIIKLENNSSKIIAVEREGGFLYQYEEGNSRFSSMKYTDGTDKDKLVTLGPYSTGALASWKSNDTTIKILTAGLQTNPYSGTSTSYTNGYTEFELKTDGSIETRHSPPIITVNGDKERYTTSIGQYIINYMFQSPEEIDDKMTFFASTQNAGLWSYREIDGVLQWNAEIKR